jgi:putative addiction module component (TIGR02574 family)
MSTAEIEQSALQLPLGERLHLARRLVESIDDARVEQASIDEGVRRLEDLVTGKVRGLTEEEFLRSLG